MKNNSSRFLVVLITILGLFAGQTFAAITYVSQFGSSGSGDGQFSDPYGIAIDSSGNIYILDKDQSRVQKFDSNGTYISQFGSYGTGDGELKNPRGLAIDSSGNIYVADTDNYRIQKFDSNGTYISQFGGVGSENGKLNLPWDIAVDSSNNIFVADSSNYRIQKFDSNGTYISQFGSAGTGNGQFGAYPRGLAIDSSGNIYVADTANYRIQKFDSNGTYISQFGTGVYGTGNGAFSIVWGLYTDSSNNVYVADRNNNRIQKFDSNGTYISQFGSYGTGNGSFYYPIRLVINSSGYIYVLDQNNKRVQKFTDIPPDTTAPNLSQTTPITTPTNDTTPSYTFTTDEAGTITYGGSCSSATTSATVGANTISFNTLADGAYSNCTITVTDAASNASSALAVTAFTVDTTGPIISTINSSILYPPGAAITWTTNEGATSRVEYGLTSSYGSLTVLDGSVVTAHTVSVVGLAQVTTYHYRVISVDAAGNSTTSGDNTFTTSGVGSGGSGAVINEEKKDTKNEEKDQKTTIREEKKDTKNEEKTQKKDSKEETKKDAKNTKAEILSDTPLYEPFATRERTLSIALRLSGIEVTGMYICQNKFTDTSTPYSCEVAEKSQTAGLISQERTTFRPLRSVSRVEAYAIFMKSVCVAPETNENNWKKVIIKKAIELGFTTRTIDNFRPDRAISTPEMFALAKQIGEWKVNNPDSCENK